MLKNNKYYYEDSYMYFSFDGVHSSEYKLFIQNKNELKIENSVGESSEFVSAMFQEGNYYTGTKKTQKTFKRKCAAEGLTLSQYKAMMKWLTTGKTGFLVFDSNPYWGWTVVLDSVGDATIMGSTNDLVVELELTFKTVGTYLARNRFPAYSSLDEVGIEEDNMSTCNGAYNTSMMCNEYGIPVIYYEFDNEVTKRPAHDMYYIQSVNNMHQHINFSYECEATPNNNTNSSSLIITYNGVEYINLSTGTLSNNIVVDYFGESNLILGDGKIIELQNYLNYNYQGNGLLQLPAEEPIKLNSVKVQNGQIILDKNEIDKLLLNGYNYICFTKRESLNNNAIYSKTDWNYNNYPAVYTTFLFFLDSVYSDWNINDLVNHNSYGDYMTNSQWHLYISNTETNSQYTIDNENYATVTFSSYMTNNHLTSDINWSEFDCYMGKTNPVKIECINTNNNTTNDTLYKRKFLTVVSCNNL